MSKAIIHISDLHVSLDSLISKINTSTELKVKDDVSAFENIFIKYKDKNIRYDEIFLIISGDIANSGNDKEYECAKLFIERLKIKKENILIIPGNHDVFWPDNQVAYSKNIVEKEGKEKAKEPYDFQKEKFAKFGAFYNSIYKKTDKFNADKIIVETIKLSDEKLLIVGLNSCFKCNSETNDKGIGYIDFTKLDIELSTLLQDFTDYSIIGVCHHNPFVNYKDKSINGFEEGNWQRVRDVLIKHNMHTILFGHEHTQGQINLNDYDYLSVGSFSKKGVDNEFELIIIEKDVDNLTLAPIHGCHKNGNNSYDYDGFWTLLPNSPYNRPIQLIQKPDIGKISSEPLLSTTPAVRFAKESEKKDISPLSQIENKFHREIFNRIKELKIFKSGHFHWSDSSRAHNWIDTPKLLNKKEDIFLIQKSILQSIEDNKIEFDLTIGLGIEWNIIASRCAAKFETQYTYLPYSYRYKDHAYYEKDLKLSKYNFKKILIITDVVHDGKTIKSILKDESEFFNLCKEVEEINVISLFFTGIKEEYRRDMLNTDNEKRFNFYYVSHIRVEECPYKNDLNWEKNCITYCEKLEKVYEFYNKNKV